MRRETLLKPFSLERAGLLIRNRFLEDLNAVLIAAGVILGINALSLILGRPALFNRPFGDPGESVWSALVGLGGLLLAGRAFLQMHNGRGGSDWLLLPASPLEKYLAAFASYALAWPVLASLAAWGLSAVLEGLAILLKAPGGMIWMPLAGMEASDAIGYVVFASFALAASARFPKLALIKGGAAATAWVLAFSLLVLGGLLIFTPEGREILAARGGALNIECRSLEAREPALKWLARISGWVSGAFAIAYGYFRVREKEAVDEVQ